MHPRRQERVCVPPFGIAIRLKAMIDRFLAERSLASRIGFHMKNRSVKRVQIEKKLRENSLRPAAPLRLRRSRRRRCEINGL